jgi:hypothetical protein
MSGIVVFPPDDKKRVPREKPAGAEAYSIFDGGKTTPERRPLNTA